MTKQVGRLHRERQAMEAQIADLFAFYTKQKEAVGPVSAIIHDIFYWKRALRPFFDQLSPRRV
jgi:hypothetical protein